MPLLESLIAPLSTIIDKVIPDKDARARAKLELLRLEGTQELRQIEARLSAIRPISATWRACANARGPCAARAIAGCSRSIRRKSR